MKVLWLINAPIPALCERAGLPVQVKEGWIEGLYNSLMALVREKKQDFELAMAFPQFSRSETIEGELDGNSFYGFYKEEDKPYKYNKRLEERLKYIKKDCLLIDLASNPGGIDKKSVKDNKLKFVWALSLPGKVAPITTAEFIKDTIYNIIKEIYK